MFFLILHRFPIIRTLSHKTRSRGPRSSALQIQASSNVGGYSEEDAEEAVGNRTEVPHIGSHQQLLRRTDASTGYRHVHFATSIEGLLPVSEGTRLL
jgi:hypothetical protein